MWARSLDWEDPLEEAMVTNSSILAWKNTMDRGIWGSQSDMTNHTGIYVYIYMCVCVKVAQLCLTLCRPM